MIIQRKISGKISSIIDLLWFIDERDLNENRRNDIIIPTGHIHIIYNFEDACFLIDGDQQLKLPDKILIGQFKKALNVKYGHRVKQVGLAIHPYSTYSLFRQVSGIYTGAIIDCSEMSALQLMHHAIIKLVDEYSVDGDVLLDEIEKYFGNYDFAEVNIEFYEKITSYLEERKGVINVKELAESFAYSVSALERNFKKYMGLTPKAYADILRFRSAMIEEDPSGLFYDQSHFLKTCRKYTNKLPADLEKAEEISLPYMLDFSKE